MNWEPIKESLEELGFEGRERYALDLGKEVVELINQRIGGPKDPHLLRQVVIGKLLHSCFYNPNDLSQNCIDWGMGIAVGTQLYGQIPRILQLHEWLVAKGFSSENVWDVGYADRYACFVANEPSFKTIFVQRQSWSYMIVLHDEYARFKGDLPANWQLHLRATASPSGAKLLREPAHVQFLKTAGETFTNNHFRYRDMRDRGYLASVKNDKWGEVPRYVTERPMIDWEYLTSAVYDLASLIDSMEE